MIAVEELDLTHLDKGFKLHLKANKSINVNDKNFWTKLRYFILCPKHEKLSLNPNIYCRKEL